MKHSNFSNSVSPTSLVTSSFMKYSCKSRILTRWSKFIAQTWRLLLYFYYLQKTAHFYGRIYIMQPPSSASMWRCAIDQHVYTFWRSKLVTNLTESKSYWVRLIYEVYMWDIVFCCHLCGCFALPPFFSKFYKTFYASGRKPADLQLMTTNFKIRYLFSRKQLILYSRTYSPT